MAMPTSGNLSICEAGLGTCRSIATAVTNTSSGSLSTNSLCAGKTAPHCMREFYGYVNAPATLSLNPTYVFFPFLGGTCQINVTASSGNAWLATVSGTILLKIVNGTGTGSGSFCITALKFGSGSASVRVESSAPYAYVYVDQDV